MPGLAPTAPTLQVLIFVFDFALSFLFFQGQGDALKQCVS